MGTAAAVAVLLRREHEIVAAFRDANATSPDRGATLDGLGIHRGIALRRLQERAVIRPAGADRYYLDDPVWQAYGRLRHRVVLVAVVVAAVVLAVALLVGALLRI